MSLYVQYGCGFSSADGWKNYDASPTLRFERIPILGKLYVKNEQRFPKNVSYGDIITGLPEKEDSCDGIYCSHVLEHLAYQDLKTALKNTYKLLKTNGIFRCVVPDLKKLAEKYLKNYNVINDPASEFMRATGLGIENRNTSLMGILKEISGNSKHLWMWDEKSLINELTNAGFTNCRRCEFNDSEDKNFIAVEQDDRFVDAVAIECRK
ncbi:methyltransferase domain-containing protein [Pedobacter polaris]|uniref:Methyltransferase domain-containing protein n=1 Tax=Pedobacter polaris TaxID=2571273 RepID=A0A4U1CKI9_9SPHI|nr:methyltransferase domain-containing protein [Pedobacter polaris]TKC08174.1 methyltransferase domain-containing protein [Pedobacter polaris]